LPSGSDAALRQRQIIAEGDAIEVVLNADGEAAYVRLGVESPTVPPCGR
jgi:hypothetical protein